MMSTDTEGFDLACELRENPRYRDLPIIIMTSFLDKVRNDGPEAYQHVLGEDWPARWLFEKPVAADKLVAKIREILVSAPADGSGSGA
jgi:DNA-binding response OmpR family regulator